MHAADGTNNYTKRLGGHEPIIPYNISFLCEFHPGKLLIRVKLDLTQGSSYYLHDHEVSQATLPLCVCAVEFVPLLLEAFLGFIGRATPLLSRSMRS